MKALLHPEQVESMPGVQKWMSHAFEARERVLREFGNASDDEKMRRMTEYNVMSQIANLKTHPSVWSRLLNGEIEIRGWVYDIGDGSIWETLSENGRFELLGQRR
jgi:carbonic anhydrase